ncbi:SEC-C domain-containing protein [Herbihabitans rhizosphaerae]|nr:SEC-C domain-containing protein [Herbihabitans rhizosphaerae]
MPEAEKEAYLRRVRRVIDNPNLCGPGMLPSTILVMIGQVLGGMGRLAEAEEAMTDAVTMEKAEGEPHPGAWLAGFLVQQDRYDDATQVFADVRLDNEAGPGEYDIYAGAYESADEFEKAETTYLIGIRIAEREGDTWHGDSLRAGLERLRKKVEPAEADGDDHAQQLLDAAGLALFWPRAEHAEALRRWPHLAQWLGEDWDEHRRNVECALADFQAQGIWPLILMADPDDYLAELRGEPDRRSLAVYAMSIPDEDPVSWPPESDEPCWCGSGRDYEVCCTLPAND